MQDEKVVTKKLEEAEKAMGIIRNAVANKKLTKAQLVQACEEAIDVYYNATTRKPRRTFEEVSSSAIPPKRRKKTAPALCLR